MSYSVFHAKAQGASHIESGLVCQDSVGSVRTESYAAIALADGHGSAKYFRSDKGSQFAVDAALACLDDFMRNMDGDPAIREDFLKQENWQRYFTQLEKSIISAWHEKVEADCSEHPFTEEELARVDEKHKAQYLAGESSESAYGTTLITVCQSEDFWFGLHIGDGKCVVCNKDKTFSEPIPWDENCFLNVTTSLCGSNAIDKFRFAMRVGDIPAATFIASDGIDDCFSASDNNQQLFKFYGTVATLFAQEEESFAKQQLEEYLPILSEKGSRDDMSVAMIYSKDLLGDLYHFDSESAGEGAENTSSASEADEQMCDGGPEDESEL